jgi:hypothetical protein
LRSLYQSFLSRRFAVLRSIVSKKVTELLGEALRGARMSMYSIRRFFVREREIERENYICSSHLGLIRWRTGTPQEIETIRDEPSDRKHVFLPQELDHCESPRSKEMTVTTADM